MKENIINKLIKWFKVDTNKISDGYHTFEELYDHRCRLFIELCKGRGDSWFSRRHSDGTTWNGWFIMGIDTPKGKQITYHLPGKYWEEVFDSGIFHRDFAPEFDGHTPAIVLERLKSLRVN